MVMILIPTGKTSLCSSYSIAVIYRVGSVYDFSKKNFFFNEKVDIYEILQCAMMQNASNVHFLLTI